MTPAGAQRRTRVKRRGMKSRRPGAGESRCLHQEPALPVRCSCRRRPLHATLDAKEASDEGRLLKPAFTNSVHRQLPFWGPTPPGNHAESGVRGSWATSSVSCRGTEVPAFSGAGSPRARRGEGLPATAAPDHPFASPPSCPTRHPQLVEPLREWGETLRAALHQCKL